MNAQPLQQKQAPAQFYTGMVRFYFINSANFLHTPIEGSDE